MHKNTILLKISGSSKSSTYLCHGINFSRTYNIIPTLLRLTSDSLPTSFNNSLSLFTNLNF